MYLYWARGHGQPRHGPVRRCGVSVSGEVDPHVEHVVADIDLVLRPVDPVLPKVGVPQEPQLV